MTATAQKTLRVLLSRASRLATLALLGVLFGAGAARAQFNAWVASTGNTSVLVIDTATNTTTATVAGTGSRVVVLSPDGAFAYSTNFNSVSKIDTATKTIVATVPTGNLTNGLAVSLNGAFLYVAVNGATQSVIVDTATFTVIATFTITAPSAIAITPDGASVWISDAFGVINVIDTATNTISTTFPLGTAPNSIAFSPNGAFAYLANFGANSVTVLDTTTHTVVATIPGGKAVSRPFFAAVTPNGAFAYVANLLSNNVSIIDTTTNTLVTTVPVGQLPRALAFTPDGASAYVTNFNDNTISVIDTATQTVTSTFPAGSRPWGIVIGQAPNVPPVLASNQASVTVSEGQTAANTGTVTDANHDTVTLTASVGTVVNNGNGTWSWSFLASEPIPSQTVTITGNDGHGGTGSTSFTLVVNDVPPGLSSVTNNGPIGAGGSVTITVAAADTTGGNDPLAYEFDCNNDGIYEIGPQAGNTATCTFATAGLHTVNVRVTDGEGGVTLGSTTVTVNHDAPDCSHAVASPNLLWPPNHKFVPIQILGVTNQEGGAVAIQVTSIFQDEPVGSGKKGCDSGEEDDHGDRVPLFPLIIGNDDGGDGNKRVDGKGVGTATASVRAERSCKGDGRVYRVSFTATNLQGLSCMGAVTVGVPRHKNVPPVDGGALFDSTKPAPHDHHGD